MAASKAISLLSTSVSPLQPATNNGSPRRHATLSAQGPSTQPKLNPSRRRTREHPQKPTGTVPFFHRPWIPALSLILPLLTLYALNPTPSSPAHPFLYPSYKLPSDNLPSSNTTTTTASHYGKGPRDLAFVTFYTLLLTFFRALLMHELLLPWARRAGIRSRAKQARFAEQMYTACYTGLVAGPWGVWAMRRTPGLGLLQPWFETRGMYESFPQVALDGVVKGYYLVQAAFWLQQVWVMVRGEEERRKDFRELVVHHGVTVGLVALSYRFHFVGMGVVVFVTHDVSDFFLAASKSLNYLNHPLQAVSLALCVAVWTYLRHYINLRILYSVATEFRIVGPFELDWAAQQYKCWISQAVTFTLLAALQALNIFWLYCLLRVAYRFAFLGVAKDDRSEAEEEEGEEDAEGAVRHTKCLGLTVAREGVSTASSGGTEHRERRSGLSRRR